MHAQQQNELCPVTTVVSSRISSRGHKIDELEAYSPDWRGRGRGERGLVALGGEDCGAGGGLLTRAVTELVESAATSRNTAARMRPPTAAAGAGAMRFRVIIILAAGGGEQFAVGRSFIDDYR